MVVYSIVSGTFVRCVHVLLVLSKVIGISSLFGVHNVHVYKILTSTHIHACVQLCSDHKASVLFITHTHTHTYTHQAQVASDCNTCRHTSAHTQIHTHIICMTSSRLLLLSSGFLTTYITAGSLYMYIILFILFISMQFFI